MTAAEAARLGDDIGHTSALGGMLLGIAVGLAVGLAIVGTIATGGLLGVALGAVFVAGMGATGGLIGMAIGQRNEGSVTGSIGSGSPDVFTVSRNQARVFLDFVDCNDHGTEKIATGSSTVFVNGEMAARRNDLAECSAKLHTDQETVLFGGETALDPRLTIRPEVPEWAVTTLTVLAWAGGIAGGLLMIPIVGVIGAGVSFAGGLVGGLAGGHIGRWVGSHWGEDGAFWGELIGGFGGGMFGGGAGARLGVAAQSRLPTYQLAAMKGRTPAQIKARQEVLYRELSKPVWRNGEMQYTPRSKVMSKVRGSDLNEPVRVRTLKQDEHFQQFRNQGQDGVGNWQARQGVTPDEVGLGEYGFNRKAGELQPKEVVTVKVPEGTRVVESTAAPIHDTWSGYNNVTKQVAPQYAPGGGKQVYAHDNTGVSVVKPGEGPGWASPPRPTAPKNRRRTMGQPRTTPGRRAGRLVRAYRLPRPSTRSPGARESRRDGR